MGLSASAELLVSESDVHEYYTCR